MDNNKRIRRKVRNAYVISTVSIALVLFLLGSVGYLILGAMGATQRLGESMTVYVMLRDDVTPEASEALSKKLSANEAVREVHFIGKDAAAEEFKEYLGDDFVEFLEQNPLPDSYELRLNAGASDKETISALEKEVSQWEGVAEVVYQRGVLEQIGQNINKFNMILLLFGGTLLIIALILLNNSRDDFLEALYNQYDEAGRGDQMVHHAAVPFAQHPAGHLCGTDRVGDADRDDDGAARRVARDQIRQRRQLPRADFCRHDGRRRTYFAALYRFRCTEIPADEFEQDPYLLILRKKR